MADQGDVSKLPRWAQVRIATAERQAERADVQMRRMADLQTPSPFYCDDFVVSGQGGPTRVRAYFQAREVTYESMGIRATIGPHPDGVDVRFEKVGEGLGVLISPRACNHIVLVEEKERSCPA